MSYQTGYVFWIKTPSPKDRHFLFVDGPNTPQGFDQAQKTAQGVPAREVQYSGFARRVVQDFPLASTGGVE